jgi:hypothetical protein
VKKTLAKTMLAVAMLVMVVAPTAPVAGVEPPTSDPTRAADYGAGWVATQISAEGFVPGPGGDPTAGQTLQAALALAAAGVEQATFERVVDWLAANVESVAAPGGVDAAGALGYLLLVADAAGADPSSFGGVDLIARLQGTSGAFEAGLYGAADPSFDGVFRQSLALLGLAAHGVSPPAAATTWLRGQQCAAGSAPAAVGGWEAYRADPASPCGAPDPGTFTGPDTNSTALAIQALVALGQTAPLDPREFLQATQDADGGFPFLAELGSDPNSTALVIQALVALGEDPDGWATAGGTPWSSLLSWQIGCDADPADVGAFASPFSDGFPDLFASLQAVWGAAGAPFPLGTASFEAGLVACEIAVGAPVDDGGALAGPGGPGPAAAGPGPAVAPRFAG